MHPRNLVIQTYRQRFQREPKYIAMAPARVNLLGEHVDYNDGFVLPAAIDRATYIAFGPSQASNEQTTLVAADYGEEAIINPQSIAAKTDTLGVPLTEWARYPAGVAWALREEDFDVPAIEAVYASDVPRGAGLSSSASVEMAFIIAWQTIHGWILPPMQRALLGQKAENQYVGVNCGIMDQFASACGVEGSLLLLDCRSLDWQPLPIPDNVAIVIADTSVRRKLTASGYNERRQACEQAVSILSQDLPNIQALRDVSVEQFNALASKLPELVEKRARHIVEEVDRTQRAIPLLKVGKIREFGKMMNQCHASLRDLYEVSIPELNSMVEIAQTLPGCLGARLTGAGFGGCTVNLVEKNATATFAQDLAERYQERTKLTPDIYICQPSAGARLMHM